MKESESFLAKVKKQGSTIIRSVISNDPHSSDKGKTKNPVDHNLELMGLTSAYMAINVDVIANYLINNVDIPSIDPLMLELGSMRFAPIILTKYAIDFGVFLGSLIWSDFYFNYHDGEFK